ncbi:MAG: aspartyl protease family protein [Spirochaetaceae bacterium]|nr:aspartyl protease family protein [Spirochaetaceae bacterium]
MGTVYTEITLKNAGDTEEVERGLRAETAVRSVTVTAMVDTGCGTLLIGEKLREKLGLAVRGLRGGTLADGTRRICQVTGPVEIHWKDRSMTCQPLVVPGSEEVLLGSIPLEDMDLLVDPVRKELTGAHGDEVLCLLK